MACLSSKYCYPSIPLHYMPADSYKLIGIVELPLFWFRVLGADYADTSTNAVIFRWCFIHWLSSD